MQILTSGQAGLIATKTSTGYLLEDVLTGEEKSSGARDLAYHFLGCTDLVLSNAKSPDAVRPKAKIARAADRALILFLFMLDPSETEDELKETATEVEFLLDGSDDVGRIIEYRLYGHELPHPVAYSRISTASAGLPRIASLFESFILYQPIIAHVRLAFDNIRSDYFEESREQFHRIAIERGLVRALVIEAASKRGIDSALFDLYAGLKDQPNYRMIIKEWTEGFKRTPRAERNWDEFKEPPPLPPLEGANIRWRQALESAMRQQQAILQKVRAGDVDTARRYVRDLVKQQKQDSEPEHLAKSLTRLSKEARDLEAYQLSLEWAEEAVAYKPDDPRTHTQVAEALIHFGRYAEAFESLDKAEAFGDAGFSATFRARILRLQQHLPEALAAYDKARKDFAGTEEEPYNWSGVAEVLRDLGRLDEALTEYTEAAAKFPDSDAILNGRASTLAELGRFEEALEVYQVVVKRSFNVAARNGVASIYKSMGEFKTAEKLYHDIALDEPYDVWSRFGLVDILEIQGKTQEAIALARETVSRFPESALAQRALGDALRDSHQLVGAAEAYGEGIQQFPFEPYFASALAQVERIRGRYEEALAAYDQAFNRFPNDKRILAGRAAMLRRLGRVEESLIIYERILSSNKNLRFASNAKASIYIHMGKYDQALELLHLDNPRSREEWQTFLLRALLDIKTGFFDAAEDRLTWSAERVPFRRVRKMILASLASVRLRRGDDLRAAVISEPCEGDVTALVRFHALASSNQEGPARALYQLLRDSFLAPHYDEVREEIARNYGIVHKRPTRDKGWLIEAETTALLLEAA